MLFLAQEADYFNKINKFYLVGVKRAQAKFIEGLLTVLMEFVGRAPYRKLSLYGSFHEKTYSRWSRWAFEFSQLNLTLIKEGVTSEERVIGVVDSSFPPKSEQKTANLSSA